MEKQNKKQIWSELQLWALFLIHLFSKPLILQLSEILKCSKVFNTNTLPSVSQQYYT